MISYNFSSALQLPEKNQAPNLILPTWWQPSRVAINSGNKWRTLHSTQYYTTKYTRNSTIAVSPISLDDGMAYFIAWDIDNNDWSNVRKLVAALPKGVTPLVTCSGKKGFHVWIFPADPIPAQDAVIFAKVIRELAGVTCEVFPTSRASRCLKWPGQKHPETGKIECFIPIDDPGDIDRYDTDTILEMLAQGYYRTPTPLIMNWLQANSNLNKINRRNITIIPTTAAQAWHQGKLLPDNVNIATVPEIALGLAKLAGRRVSKIGQAFRCILPGHEERRPSASFCVTEDKRILYHDFHQRDGEEWYTLGEVYHAIVSGEVKKLRPVDSARWLARLAMQLGFESSMTARTKANLSLLSNILGNLKLTKGDIYFILGCRIASGDMQEPSNSNTWPGFGRVWKVVCEEFLIHAMSGLEEVALSKRFVARRAGVSGEQANRILNLLCVLGLLEKTPVVKHEGKLYSDRFRLCTPNQEEVQRRWVSLGKPSLREFNRELVAGRLGEDVAANVFRRMAKENP
ncbi:hypothetical protein SEF58_10685 [Neomoorella humiferrea]|uniref:TOTE conflict system archaeo-eukaryotic primase domain-containing protein n=1 Tax=Neomoorella humiferrea TaxID=676965 RepID=UPI003D8E1A72